MKSGLGHSIIISTMSNNQMIIIIMQVTTTGPAWLTCYSYYYLDLLAAPPKS